MNYWDEQMEQATGEAISMPFDLVLGQYWPHATDDAAAKPLNNATKYVASRRHFTLGWDNSVLIEGDAAEGIAGLKQEDRPELQVHGSGNLIQTLLRHNLVDQYRLGSFPFSSDRANARSRKTPSPPGLSSSTVRSLPPGVVIGTYEPAGEIVPGSFALD